LFFISISYSFAFPYYLKAQSDEKVLLFQRFLKEYKTSDLVSAERTLFQLIELKEKLTKDQLRTVYNNLGATCTLLGSYNEALNYYNYAESLIEKNNSSKEVADIYINKAIKNHILRQRNILKKESGFIRLYRISTSRFFPV
jgi:tetratricopeptide (TPR) repeat protein